MAMVAQKCRKVAVSEDEQRHERVLDDRGRGHSNKRWGREYVDRTLNPNACAEFAVEFPPKHVRVISHHAPPGLNQIFDGLLSWVGDYLTYNPQE